MILTSQTPSLALPAMKTPELTYLHSYEDTGSKTEDVEALYMDRWIFERIEPQLRQRLATFLSFSG